MKLPSLLPILILGGLSLPLELAAQSRAFTYQGKLQDGGAAADGVFDFEFRLWDHSSAGLQIGSAAGVDDVTVVDGVFTVSLEFGDPAAFDGSDSWLEILVKADAEASFTVLSPRQPVTPSPYAIHAFSAASVSDGSLPSTYADPVSFSNPSNQFSGAFSGDGGSLTGLEWAALYGMPTGFADAIDNDTTYSTAEPLSLTGTTIGLSSGGADVGNVLKRSSSGFEWQNDNDTPNLWSQNGENLYYDAGNVGVGTSNPSAKLHVKKDGDRVAKFDRYNSDGQIVTWARDDQTVGDVSVAGGMVSYNAFTGSHYAWSDEEPDRGALMRLTGVNRVLGGQKDGETIYGIAPTSWANDPVCLGAFLSTTPAEDLESEVPIRLVAAVGNGKLRVVDTGRDIAPGDLLVSSHMEGCAMLDDPGRFATGHIVARAAQKVTWSELGSDRTIISVLFNSFTRGPGLTLSGADEVCGVDSELSSLRETVANQQALIEVLAARLDRLAELDLVLARLNAALNDPAAPPQRSGGQASTAGR